MSDVHYWELREPDAAAAGLPFARARIDPAGQLMVHAAPAMLEVEIRSADGTRLALGENLRRTGNFPMARLTVRDGAVEREDLWPGEADLGRPVILPGGEAGILTAWHQADDGSEWRWSVEFFNRR